MKNTLPLLELTDFPVIKRDQLTTLQVNLGYLCNQSCVHCHVNAGPRRSELMDRETIDLVLDYVAARELELLDITGGAPEMNPHFKYLVETARELGVSVMDRCNLTILLEPGYQDIDRFLAQHQVVITASLPCYSQQNVDQQRGKGVFQQSIEALRQLNELGYGKEGSGLELNLVYNPIGPYLPPAQAQLEQDYKAHLKEEFGIEFNQLFVLANMPISRFGSTLITKGEFTKYMDLLKSNYSEDNLQAVMCRSLISVDYQGYLYDCDFNQMLGMPLGLSDRPVHLRDMLAEPLQGRQICVADHCFGCTAGQGSSCGGALNGG